MKKNKMMNLIRSEVKLAFQRRNMLIFVIALIGIVSMYFFVYEKDAQAYPQQQSDYYTQRQEQAKIRIDALIDLKKGYESIDADIISLEAVQVRIDFWKQEQQASSYLQNLWNKNQDGQYDQDIRISQRSQDEAIKVALEAIPVTELATLLHPDERTLQNRMQVAQSYEQSHTEELVNKQLPTGSAVLVDILDMQNPLFLLLLICCILWNVDCWSSEFENSSYRLLFTLPYTRRTIFLTRSFVRIGATLLGIGMLIFSLFLLGTLLHGDGLSQLTIMNEQVLQGQFRFEVEELGLFDQVYTNATYITHALGISMVYFLCITIFIQMISLFVKDNGVSLMIILIIFMLVVMNLQSLSSELGFAFNPFFYGCITSILYGMLGISIYAVYGILAISLLVCFLFAYQYLKCSDLKEGN